MADLSAAQKAKVVALSKKRMAGKGALLYLYDPVNDRCLPAVCDEQGFIKIDPAELDERYHKKGEDLDVGAYDLFLGAAAAGFCLNEQSATILRLYNRAKNALRSLSLNTLYPTNGINFDYTNTGFIIANNASGAYIRCITKFGGDKIVWEAVDGEFNIPRAGDITGLAGKTLTFPGAVVETLTAARALTTQGVIAAKVIGDAVNRLLIYTTGKMEWSDGTNAADTNLYKAGFHLLKTDDNFNAVGYIDADLGFKDNGVQGVDGTFNDADANVVTVSGGIITNLDT